MFVKVWDWKEETLKILNREKIYEDKLVTLLFNYYITSIDGIGDIEDKDKKISGSNLAWLSFQELFSSIVSKAILFETHWSLHQFH
mgnify:CR=1 FL=1